MAEKRKRNETETNGKKIKLYPKLVVPKSKQLGRSYEKIEKSDLERLLKLSMDDFNDLKKRKPEYRKSKIISVCLCQGGALHYVDGKNGIRDFDVYIFFDNSSPIKWQCRRRIVADFGESKFGRTYEFMRTSTEVDYDPKYKGRKVDLMGRDIHFDPLDTYIEAIQKYLSEENTPTAHYLSLKAVVVLSPVEDMGKVIW